MAKENKKIHISHAHGSLTEGKEVDKSKLEKAAELFFAEDVSQIKNSVVEDFLVPRAKSAGKDAITKVKQFISETASGVVDTILFGSAKGSKTGTTYYKGSSVNYVRYDPYDQYDYTNSYRNSSIDRDPRNNVKYVEIASYGKAQEVLGELIGYTQKYPEGASVGDYYQLVKVATTEIDFQIGWRNLKDARVVKFKNGWTIEFPKPIPLD